MPATIDNEGLTTKTRIRKKFQVTIPQGVRDAFPLEEGQYVNVEATPKGILITPAREIDPGQAWFWSPRWAALEHEADADFRAGRVREADSAETAIATLKRKPARHKKR